MTCQIGRPISGSNPNPQRKILPEHTMTAKSKNLTHVKSHSLQSKCLVGKKGGTKQAIVQSRRAVLTPSRFLLLFLLQFFTQSIKLWPPPTAPVFMPMAQHKWYGHIHIARASTWRGAPLFLHRICTDSYTQQSTTLAKFSLGLAGAARTVGIGMWNSLHLFLSSPISR